MKAAGYGSASGKIILMGEHSVVYGEPAIAFPFQATRITAELEPSVENTLFSDYYSGPLTKVPAHLHNIRQLTEKLQEALRCGRTNLTIHSTIPGERGMGSSAAVAVAITRSYFDYMEQTLTEAELLHYVNFSEKIAHGNPSGIDAAATSGQEPLLFTKGQPFETFDLNINAFLIVADTGVKGRTRETVKEVAHRFQQAPKSTGKLIKNLGLLTQAARQAIIDDQPTVLGQAMNEAHKQLATLGVSNQTLDRLISCARQNGALGAKLTGGGRGGCLIALAADQQTAQEIATALTHQGAHATWIQQLGVVTYA